MSHSSIYNHSDRILRPLRHLLPLYAALLAHHSQVRHGGFGPLVHTDYCRHQTAQSSIKSLSSVVVDGSYSDSDLKQCSYWSIERLLDGLSRSSGDMSLSDGKSVDDSDMLITSA
jgi:hypothetical protein